MPSSPAAPVIGPDQVRPLRRAEYDQLVALGAFDGERLELLDGALIAMSPRNPPHAATIAHLTKLLLRRLSDGYELRVQLPLSILDDSSLEPDVAILAPGDYHLAHPTTALLVIEVADSSLARDRRKAKNYAAAGIPEYWIVDLNRGAVEVYTEPSSTGYGTQRAAVTGEVLCAIVVPELKISVTEMSLPAT